MNDNQVQKLSDDALDEVSGGYDSDILTKYKDKYISVESSVFANEYAPMVLAKCREVKAGKDRVTAWNELMAVLDPLIRENLPFSAGDYLDGGYIENYFNNNCR